MILNDRLIKMRSISSTLIWSMISFVMCWLAISNFTGHVCLIFGGLPLPMGKKGKAITILNIPMQKSCVTTIELPAGFEVETLPAAASLKFTYGNYEIKYVYNKDKNQVVSTAKFVLNNHVIPAAKYTEMQQYMDGIAKAQNKKLVIRKKA